MCVHCANLLTILFLYTVYSNDLFQVHFSGLSHCEQWLVRSRYIVYYDCKLYKHAISVIVTILLLNVG